MTATKCFICGKPADEQLGELSYQPFVAAHDCEYVYVHVGCIEPLQAIEENLYEQVTRRRRS
jgi:hypothetical protein